MGQGAPCRPQLTQVVIVFLLALLCQGSALGICNGDPQHHPERLRLRLNPTASPRAILGTGEPRPAPLLAVTAGSNPWELGTCCGAGDVLWGWGHAVGLGTRCGAGDVPVSSLFWVRSAGQELLVTPTSEAVTWGSPLYTFM